MEKVNDCLYVQRVKAGDIQAFGMIVAKYGKMVFTIVRKIVENREDAEDITQEVFIRVFKSLERFREESEFSTWLYRIAYNTTMSELRKKKLFLVSSDSNTLIDNNLFADEKDDEIEIKLQYLEKALKKLPPDEIFLVTLHYMDGQSIECISKITDLSVSNVKVKLHRIRRKLAVEIGKLMQNE
ncbi:MAG: sigma-70 family RNA polymerase sigma factor [Prevotellaceae bacterium]|jgi:RNA polymerase sigma-70 factor (ECF subfamily)|nr:sigma-70 family RNA polymerase sigma factor [Prevotellaceae bacterium]